MSLGKNKTCCQKTKDILWKIWKSTLGNRRLSNYILDIVKFLSITLIQATQAFPTDEQFFSNYGNIFFTLGFCWMATLIILFTERYFRELVAVRRKTTLTIWVNWVECVIFTLYFLYSLVIGIIHFYAIAYHSEYYGPTTTTIEFFEVIILLFMIYEKWVHFFRSGSSRSLFLGKPDHIPKIHHDPKPKEHLEQDEKGDQHQPLLNEDHIEDGPTHH